MHRFRDLLIANPKARTKAKMRTLALLVVAAVLLGAVEGALPSYLSISGCQKLGQIRGGVSARGHENTMLVSILRCQGKCREGRASAGKAAKEGRLHACR